MRSEAPNNLLESNRHPASPLRAEQQFGRAVHARACVFGDDRSAKDYGIT